MKIIEDLPLLNRNLNLVHAFLDFISICNRMGCGCPLAGDLVSFFSLLCHGAICMYGMRHRFNHSQIIFSVYVRMLGDMLFEIQY